MAKLVPEEYAELSRWLDHKRAEIKRQRRSGRVDPGLVEELGNKYQELENRGSYEEALEVIEVAFNGLKYVKQPKAQQSLR